MHNTSIVATCCQLSSTYVDPWRDKLDRSWSTKVGNTCHDRVWATFTFLMAKIVAVLRPCYGRVCSCVGIVDVTNVALLSQRQVKKPASMSRRVQNYRSLSARLASSQCDMLYISRSATRSTACQFVMITTNTIHCSVVCNL